MQDNFDKAWKDKLAGYQAPADPQDWAAMAAALDANDNKKAGFWWWWLLALALLVSVGGLTYQFIIAPSQGNGQTLAGNVPDNNEPTNNPNGTAAGGNNNTAETQTFNSNSTIDTDPSATTPSTDNNEVGNTATSSSPSAKNPGGTTATSKGATNNNYNTITNPNKTKNNKNNKNSNKPKNNNNTAVNSTTTGNSSNTTGNGSGLTSGNNKGNGTANNKGKSKGKTPTGSNPYQSHTGNNNTSNAGGNTGGTSDVYDEPVGNLSLKKLNKLPTPTFNGGLSMSRDTSKLQFKAFKPRVLSHHLGVSAGWSNSWVDRSGDNRPGYNTGVQYTMMIRNRFGIHAGLAFRDYRYFTDLVACNYEVYQCPNSYSSTLHTIDLNVGAQVNLVKTDKVEWYVMGGVSNQFMMLETFEYSLPVIDTPSNPAPPIEPPRNTSFTGAGVSDFEESISISADANLTTGTTETGPGKFLRERYLGSWYAGTGVTWHFYDRMNLQVEPVIGRSFQFVGIQDKKLWNTGVNVRLNFQLGR